MMANKPSYEELEKRVRELEQAESEYKQTEEALRESEEEYRQLFESSMVGIGLSDKSGRALVSNDKMVEITGYSKDELSRLNIKKIYADPKDREELLGLINRYGKIDNFETRLLNKQGEEYWVNLSLRLIDHKGKKVILTSLIDITRRKLAEEKLVEDEAIVKAIFNSSFDAMALIDTSGIINNINETMASYMRRSVKELIGMFGWSLISSKMSQSRKSITEKVIQSGKTIRFEDERQGIHFDNVFHPVMDTHGRTTKIAIIARDITDRIKAQKIIQKEKKDLEKKVKERTIELEETNTALGVLLKKRERDKAEVEEKVVLNVKVMIEPYLKKLKKNMLNNKQMIYLDILESNVKEIISPFGQRLSSRLIRLTPTELKVANLIRQGKRTKEIAILSNVSPETISRHRKSIRKKLNLTEKKLNLRTCLSSLA